MTPPSPCSLNCRIACLQPSEDAPALMAKSRSKSSTVCSSKINPGRGVGTPTLLKMMSRRPKLDDRERDRRLDVGFPGHVALVRERGAAGVLDQLHRLLGAVEVDVGDDDLGALLREPQRRGAADARPGAHDDRRLALEQHAHAPSSFSSLGHEADRARGTRLHRVADRVERVTGGVDDRRLGLVVVGEGVRARTRCTCRCPCRAHGRPRSTPSARRQAFARTGGSRA